MLAGPGDQLAEARERQTDYFRQHPEKSDLDYLLAAVGRLEEYEATRALVDRHNPMQLASPSPDMATELLDFWRRINPATGTLVHDFTDEHYGTRFLGDLYQDLSEQARTDYALFQTPEFIEEFIIDRTLDPAIDEYGLEEVMLIDPACGSGHFLLGAFARLLRRWRQQEPGTNVRVLVERVLGQVHGVDINPYAAAIARFRLVVAALTACRVTRLADAPAWKIRVAIGDSLRFGVQYGQDVLVGVAEQALTGTAGEGEFVYEYEDAAELQAILGQRYHSVVANPPYPTVKDPTLNKLYRELWDACSGHYTLSTPFAQRLFDLAVEGGFTGQITANSFMKRDFGKKLIEKFFPTIDLTLVADTSGAYIPGHGTPTVILCGRKRRPVSRTVRAILGIRGEPDVPAEPSKGLVWQSIVENVGSPGFQNDYVSVVDLERSTLNRYPWSLAGGGAADLQKQIEQASQVSLGARIHVIGRTTHTGSDDAFYMDARVANTYGLKDDVVPVVLGENVRDYVIQATTSTLFPYDDHGDPRDFRDRGSLRRLWPLRVLLSKRVDFQQTIIERGLRWYDHSMFFANRYRSPRSIAFAFVATHNHFVLDRGGKVFNRSAPVIKLRDSAAEEDFLRLLGLLNSSTACFWLKQVSYPKGGDPLGDEGARVSAEQWSDRYELSAGRLEEFPLPRDGQTDLVARLVGLAAELHRTSPAEVASRSVPSRGILVAAHAEWERIRSEMISTQEELDWEVYRLYGLLGDDAEQLIGSDVNEPGLKLGERAFEIALARKVSTDAIQTDWFKRHRSTPITTLPTHWPPEYQALVARRLAKIAEDPYLHLIERPECKRRWATRSWEEMESEAVREWLLERLENETLWFRPAAGLRSIAQLTDALLPDPEFVSVARLYARDADLGDVMTELVKDQHVPFLAALRYTESGLRTWAQWEETWELQRREDAREKVGDITVPPKYRQGDFRDLVYWRNRGKLDVPEERFISYPGSTRDGTLLLGWAGWDHLQQAQALTAYITERRELDAWDAARLAPLLAGIVELLPWVAQWHPDVDPEFGVRPAEAYDAFLDEQLLQLGLTRYDLTAWRPEPSARGRRRAT
jgi:hypothetical protein